MPVGQVGIKYETSFNNRRQVDAYACLSPFATRYVVGLDPMQQTSAWVWPPREQYHKSAGAGEKRRIWLLLKQVDMLSIFRDGALSPNAKMAP